MKIEEVKVGDRCWVVYGGEEDKYRQNATVTEIRLDGDVFVYEDGGGTGDYTPGQDVFWARPECPPKPKRKVKREIAARLSGMSVNFLAGSATLEVTKIEPNILTPLDCPEIGTPLTVQWEEEE